MSELLLRWQALRDRLRHSLWVLPTITVVVGVVAAETLGQVATSGDSGPGGVFVFAGSAEAARTVLGSIAGSMITVTGLTFSLTVVALQVASGQFTPRLLRTFMADRGNQVVLSAFIGTFAYSLVLLRRVRAGTASLDPEIPGVGVTVAILATLTCVGLLVYFIHHLTSQLRVETVIAEVTRETVAAVDSAYPRPEDGDGAPPRLPEPPDRAHRIAARLSGTLQSVDLDALLDAGRDHGVDIRLRPWIGGFVPAGTTLAWTWRREDEDGGVDASPLGDDDLDAIGDRVHASLHIGLDRFLHNDVAFGIRQLVDIAARALSPGVNDPTTAVQAIQHLSVILIELAGRPLHDAVESADGVEVGHARPGFAANLDLACDQIRRYGGDEPAIAIALLQLLRDTAEATDDPERLQAIARHGDEVEGQVDDAGLAPRDRDGVDDMLDGLRRVLAGRADPGEARAD